MRLLKIQENGELSLVQFHEDEIPPYAILSHTWGPDTGEPSFTEMQPGTEEVKAKAGYRKVIFCHRQAIANGINYFWIDTCCIDKSSSAELSEAINSMFRWYQNASQCYVYLADVSITGESPTKSAWLPLFKQSNWFTRGWTLQELIAPKSVEFFSSDNFRLGDKNSLQHEIHEITNIPVTALSGYHLSSFSLPERFSWAEQRQTKRGEDRAYSLLGIFNVFIPPIYGEGRRNAEARLHREILHAQETEEKPSPYSEMSDLGPGDRAKQKSTDLTDDEKREIKKFDDSNQMGDVYFKQAKYVDAEKMYLQALKGKKKILGLYHPSTLYTINNLGHLNRAKGNFEKAEQMYLQAFHGRKRLYRDSDHPLMLESVHDLGVVYRDHGLLDESEKSLTRALQGKESVLGLNHTSTLFTVNMLGLLYRLQGMHGKAEQMHRRALQGLEKEFGPDNERVLNVAVNLSLAFKGQGKLQEAELMCLRAVKGLETALGLGHARIFVPLVHLASIYQDQGKLEEAEILYTKVLKGWKQAPEQSGIVARPSFLMIKHDFGYLRAKQGKFDEAEALILEVLSSYEQIFGTDHDLYRQASAELAQIRAERSAEVEKTLAPQNNEQQSTIATAKSTAKGNLRRNKILQKLGLGRNR